MGLPPEPELLWTPGYWGWNDGVYVFNDGYWGPESVFTAARRRFRPDRRPAMKEVLLRNGASLLYNESVNIFRMCQLRNVYSKTVVVNKTTNVKAIMVVPVGLTAKRLAEKKPRPWKKNIT